MSALQQEWAIGTSLRDLDDAGSGPRPFAPLAITLRDVSKVYGHAGAPVAALDRVSLDIAEGQFVCLVGASGCGKSTLLNLIAGLDRPTAGTLQCAAGDAALMFQDSALFPWLTVARNVELALRLRKVPKSQRKEQVSDLLAKVRLNDFADKRPHELSGGMRQRVALARALAQERRVLLMDEPFGALDAITRDLLHDEIEQLWKQSGLTIVFVTHNVSEAVRLGDRVILLSSRPGRVVADFEVPVARPRRADAPEVGELSARITARLRDEVRRHSDD
jgi:NitT/TauT family transport system ATP-binding protein